jgi:hypothetical protein
MEQAQKAESSFGSLEKSLQSISSYCVERDIRILLSIFALLEYATIRRGFLQSLSVVMNEASISMHIRNLLY